MALILDEFRDLCFDRPNFLSKNSDYWNYSQKIIEKEEHLTSEEMEKLESILADVNKSNRIEVENAFNQGFCAGVKLMAKIFSKK